MKGRGNEERELIADGAILSMSTRDACGDVKVQSTVRFDFIPSGFFHLECDGSLHAEQVIGGSFTRIGTTTHDTKAGKRVRGGIVPCKPPELVADGCAKLAIAHKFVSFMQTALFAV